MQQGSSSQGTSVEAAWIMEAPESVKVKLLVAQSHLTVCNPMDCSLPDSSVPAVLQARIWRGLPCPSSGYLSNPGIRPRSPALQANSSPSESPGKSWRPLNFLAFSIFTAVPIWMCSSEKWPLSPQQLLQVPGHLSPSPLNLTSVNSREMSRGQSVRQSTSETILRWL